MPAAEKPGSPAVRHWRSPRQLPPPHPRAPFQRVQKLALRASRHGAPQALRGAEPNTTARNSRVGQKQQGGLCVSPKTTSSAENKNAWDTQCGWAVQASAAPPPAGQTWGSRGEVPAGHAPKQV